MALICISLMANDVEHLLMWLLAICIFYLEKCLFRSFAHFLKLSFFYWVVNIPYVCRYKLFTTCDLQIFPPVLPVVFSLSWQYTLKNKHFIWLSPIYLFLWALLVLLVSYLIRFLPNSKSRFTLKFSSKNFIFLPLLVRSILS